MQFKELGLDKRLVERMDHQGFQGATEIQQQAIPVVIAGKDLLASSKTGSGKTLAYLLPAMQRVIKQKAFSKRDPRVVVLAPTRELAKQVYGQLRGLTAGSNLKGVLILGGEDFNLQSKALAKDPQFVIATPGRLADHLEHGHLELKGLEMLILDEADRMLDLGFSKQLTAIHKAADHRRRQTLMFSATMDNAVVNEFGADLLSAPARVRIDAEQQMHDNISHTFLLSDHLDHKQAQLMTLLKQRDYKQAMLFTATRGDTERLASWLAEQGFSTLALSGDLSQAARNRIMDEFAAGKAQLLITTDVASRGLDISQVQLVINFDLPKHSEEYIHRVGRTGRAGASGAAVSLVGPKDWAAAMALQSFLGHSLSFDALEGLEAKFTGLKPKKAPAKAGDKAAKTKAKPARARKSAAPKKVKKTAFVLKDVGDVPFGKKKAPQGD
ncbi:Superfamily II DNA and RNA helicase [Ferrimonas sediminum]|uniref:Superfamily II DNA and RNA helicase n=1 Tax=Ferrimonas sediminum TaxID=718193 RepID=A0A1G8UY36_9GAMM|nr:DEAD/DEAH box helicase [Ferrimonas sediminum]SDJ58554.1 Superfamily II DNA and RNA helicase [Ferrimonas sediminum]